MKCATFVFVTLAGWYCSGVLGDPDFIKIGTFNWATVSKLGKSIEFECILSETNKTILPTNCTEKNGTESWHLPNGKWINVSTSHWEIKGNSSTLKSLVIHNITEEDSGIYYCHVGLSCQNPNITDIWIKHGLNLNGPLYANPLDKYRVNFIMASASSGGVGVLMLLLCLIHKFRYKQPQELDIGLSTYDGVKIVKIDEGSGVGEDSVIESSKF